MAQKGAQSDLDTGYNARLKPKEVAKYRESQRKKQNGRCPLCKGYIRKEQATLDHDHSTGHVRTTLHRNCNSVEGRILHWARRSGTSPKKFLENLLKYWDMDYSKNPLHPNHRTTKQKKATNLRRRIRKAKRSSTKARLKQELQEYLDE